MNPVWKLKFFLFNIEGYGKFFSGITPETINLFSKWTIVRPSCFAPKKYSSPIYLGPKKSRPRYISAQKISFAIELTG